MNGGHARGYCDTAAGSGRCNTPYGSLSDTDFTIGSTTYVVESIRWGRPGGVSHGTDRLHLTLDKDLPTDDLASYELVVDTHEFALSDAVRSNPRGTAENNYRWTSNEAITALAVDAEVTVKLLGSTSDARLSALALSDGTLAPTFDRATESYTASVDHPVSRITVTPTTNQSSAAVQYLDASDTVIPDADTMTDGQQVNLSPGENTIKIKVTAEDATTTKTYTVTVTRGTAAADATLSALSLSDGTLAPAFAHSTQAYTASVANSRSRITVTPTTNQSAAAVQYLDASDTAIPDADTMTDGQQVNLEVGENTIKIKVTATDTTTTKTYTVTVTRSTAATDATLSALSLSDGTLAPTFASSTQAYTATVANSRSRITVTATPGQSAATVEYLDASDTEIPDADTATDGQQVDLSPGENTIKIKVTATDGATTNTYTLTVTRTAFAPAAPGSLTAVAGDGRAFLNWSAPSTDGGAPILRYEYRYKSGTGDYPTAWTAVPDGPDAGTDASDETFVTVMGLTNGDAHTFQLRAVNVIGEGAAAESSTVTPATAAACAMPTYTGGAQEVLVATLTAATGAFSSTVSGVGFSRQTDAFGTLSVTQFTVGSTTYTIDFIGDFPDVLDRFAISLTSDPTATEIQRLVVYVCGEAFRLADRSAAHGATNTFLFNNRETGLAAGATRVVRIGYDEVAPSYESGAVNQATVTLTFDEDLDTGSVPASSAFAVQVDGTAAPLAAAGAVTLSGATVMLTLASAPAATARTLTVDYTAPDSGPLRDAAHNRVANFSESPISNEAPTGKPAISGFPRVGDVLTASKGTLSDSDGLTRADAGRTGYVYRYQWVRVDGTTETDIVGATSATYTLAAADLGKQIKVRADFTDDEDYEEESTASAAFPNITIPSAVSEVLPAAQCSAPDISGERQLWSGTVSVAFHAGLFHGYSSASSQLGRQLGSLTSTGTFRLPNSRIDARQISVHAVYLVLWSVTNPSVANTLNLELRPSMTTAPLAHTTDSFANQRLLLYICDHRVVVWDQTHLGHTAGDTYVEFVFDYPGVDWSTYSTRDVRLTWDEEEVPTFVSGRLDGTSLTLTFSEPLDPDTVPAATAFTVSVGGTAV